MQSSGHDKVSGKGGEMSERIDVVQVGAPDPELNNSPILDESADDELSGVDPDGVVFAHCQFNGVDYTNGTEVCSGDERLLCSRGVWLRAGSCDRDNP